MPCTITLVLSGFVKVVFKPTNHTSATYHSDSTAQLFKTTLGLYRGDVGGLRSWSDSQSGPTQDYAFSMSFPYFISYTDLFDRSWGPIYSPDEQDKFEFDSAQPIPPLVRLDVWSTQTEQHGVVVEIQYELRVFVEVPDSLVGDEDPKAPTRIEYERLWIGKSLSLSADLHIRYGSLAVGKVGTNKGGSVPSHESQGRQSLRVKASGLLQKSMSTAEAAKCGIRLADKLPFMRAPEAAFTCADTNAEQRGLCCTIETSTAGARAGRGHSNYRRAD